MKLMDFFIEVAVNSGKAIAGLTAIQSKAKQTNETVGEGFLAAGKKMAAGIGIAYGVQRAITGVVDSYVEVENGMIGVAKTTGLGGKALDDLREKIFDMGADTTLSATTAELMELAQVAGGMGFTTPKDIAFVTESMAKLGAATQDMVSGAEGARQMMAILTNSKEGVDNLDNLGAALVAMGNVGKSNEGQIMSVAERVSKAFAVYGAASEDIIGLSSAMADMQITPENAGTAIAKAMGEIEVAMAKGGKGAKVFEKALGKSREEITAMLKNDPAQLFVDLTKAMKKSVDAGEPLPLVLQDMGLEGTILSQTFGGMLQSLDNLQAMLEKSRAEFEKNAAMTAEAKAASESYTAKTTALSNAMTELGYAIGDSGFIDFLSNVALGLADFVRGVSDFLTKNPEFVTALGLVAAAMTAIVVAMSPLLGAIFLISAAAALIIQNWGPIKQFFTDLWAGVVASFNWAKGKVAAIADWFIAKANAVQAAWNSAFEFLGYDMTTPKGKGSAPLFGGGGVAPGMGRGFNQPSVAPGNKNITQTNNGTFNVTINEATDGKATLGTLRGASGSFFGSHGAALDTAQ